MPEPAKSTVASATDPEAPPPIKAVTIVLQEHRNGGLNNEAGEHLSELVAAVKEHQKAGKLTIELTVAPVDGDPRQVKVTDVIKVSAPKAKPPASLFFSDAHGNLSRRDPRQPELSGLRDASAS